MNSNTIDKERTGLSNMVRLYHGSHGKNLDSILANGLIPRQCKDSGNYSGVQASVSGYVYLTDSNPMWYAAVATPSEDRIAGSALFVEVEVDEANLYPDEDFLRQMGQIAIASNRPLTFNDDNAENKKHWKLSLENLGTVAHLGEIPAPSITRYALVNISKGSKMIGMGSYIQQASIAQHIEHGEMYGMLMEFIFDGRNGRYFPEFHRIRKKSTRVQRLRW